LASFSSQARWVDFFGLTFSTSGAAGSATAAAVLVDAGLAAADAGGVAGAGAGPLVAAEAGAACVGATGVGGFTGVSGADSSGISMAPWAENENYNQDARLKASALH
jgi:hypothetical protein